MKVKPGVVDDRSRTDRGIKKLKHEPEQPAVTATGAQIIPPAETGPAAVRLEITGVESLERSITGGSMYPTQMGLQKPTGFITAADLGHSLVTYGNFDADFSVTGMFSEDQLSFGMFLEAEDTTMLSCNNQPGDIGILPVGSSHFARHNGKTKYFVTTADHDHLMQLADAEGIDVNPRMLTKMALYRPGRAWARNSTAYIRRICDMIEALEAPFLGTTQDAARTRAIMRDDILRLLLHSMVQTDLATLEGNPTEKKAEELIRTAKYLIWKDMSGVPTVNEIAKALGVSLRSLYRIFQSRLGMSPARYLKLYRMSRVFLDLANAQAHDRRATIENIALSWGFGDPGRFAGEYRRLFGEYPAQTLRHRTSAPDLAALFR